MLSTTAAQAVLLDSEVLENVEKFKCLGLMVVANGQSIEEIKSRINPARSSFSRLQLLSLVVE